VRFGRKIGFEEPFLEETAKVVIERYGKAFPELESRREFILATVRQEEERFLNTLDLGMDRLEGVLEGVRERSETTLPGDDAFRLYDTFGLPLEITRDVAEEHGMQVDEAGYQVALEAQRERARAAESFEKIDEESLRGYRELLEALKDEGGLGPQGVEHDPYSSTELQTEVVGIRRDGELVASARPKDQVEVILAATSYYFESGGQISDAGSITAFPEGGDEPIWEVEIDHVLHPVEGLIVHVGKVAFGEPNVGDAAWALVDYQRRIGVARNHTATHLLHHELRYVLGQHVQQAGSLVSPDRLRFDFTHPDPLTKDELSRIGRGVNSAVLVGYPVLWEQENYRQALDEGVIALFGEKYGNQVRVLRIGWPGEPFSQELCGGTHVDDTAEIGFFHIVSEQGIGAGVRRIEAVTGRGAVEWTEKHLSVLETAAAELQTQPEEVGRKVLDLKTELQAAHKEVLKLQQKLARQDFEQLLDRVQEVQGMSLLAARVEVPDRDTLLEMTDWYRERIGTGVVVLGTVFDGRPALVAAVTPDLVERGVDAVKLVRDVAQTIGGGGGGRPTLAQAGGKDAGRLDEALQQAPRLLEDVLK
jgi:alanyl-tRNA synthetase